MDYKKYIADLIDIDGVSKEELYDLIALPPNTEMGDYALPCFKFAKLMRKSPVMIAEELKTSIMSNIIPMCGIVSMSDIVIMRGIIIKKRRKTNDGRRTDKR